MTELDQNLEPLTVGMLERIDGARRGSCGGRTVAEAVHHAEERTTTADVDRDRLVTGNVLARKRATRGCPLDRTQATVVTHGPEPISTFR
jgi:hypothetical protein